MISPMKRAKLIEADLFFMHVNIIYTIIKKTSK